MFVCLPACLSETAKVCVVKIIDIFSGKLNQPTGDYLSSYPITDQWQDKTQLYSLTWPACIKNNLDIHKKPKSNICLDTYIDKVQD